jgi:D-xylose reductase
VGEGIRNAVRDGLVRREELWIVSKLWNTYHRKEHVAQAATKSLNLMQLEYFDLYLVHFPIALHYVPITEHYPPGWMS